ncbi:MAG: Fic family protein [Dehalococcoidia bacterium]|nr:Fic family protein [Dehalococcoidia bacterium]
MDKATFGKPSGELVPASSALTGRPYFCFVPAPLPPDLTPAELGRVAGLLAAASQAFGRLAGLGQVLPNPDLLVRPYMRREAILSSRIENTHTSFAELVAFEATGADVSPGGATREVFNYVAAVEYGLRHVMEAGFTVDLVRGIHRTLMRGARGEHYATPGELRTVQNHIGGGSNDPADAHFVPPPAARVPGLLDGLFAYLQQAEVSPLIQAAWMHYQFETIHPFLDGNGRVGRVLIPLLFAHRHQMPHPLLYLSPYFERDRSRYYDRLFAVSARSEWVPWLEYFLAAVLDQSNAAVALAQGIVALGPDWHGRLDAMRAPQSAHRLADLVHQHVAVNAQMVRTNLGVSPQTAYNAIDALVAAGILVEMTDRPRDRVWLAGELHALFGDL